MASVVHGCFGTSHGISLLLIGIDAHTSIKVIPLRRNMSLIMLRMKHCSYREENSRRFFSVTICFQQFSRTFLRSVSQSNLKGTEFVNLRNVKYSCALSNKNTLSAEKRSVLCVGGNVRLHRSTCLKDERTHVLAGK